MTIDLEAVVEARDLNGLSPLVASPASVEKCKSDKSNAQVLTCKNIVLTKVETLTK